MQNNKNEVIRTHISINYDQVHILVATVPYICLKVLLYFKADVETVLTMSLLLATTPSQYCYMASLIITLLVSGKL